MGRRGKPETSVKKYSKKLLTFSLFKFRLFGVMKIHIKLAKGSHKGSLDALICSFPCEDKCFPSSTGVI